MNIGKFLTSWRYAEKLGIREAAKEIGLSTATFNRVERGELMDGSTLSKIIIYLLQESPKK